MQAPANGATELPNALILKWLTREGADAYDVQVARDAAFTEVLVEESTSVTPAVTVTGLEIGARYYWHVRARNADDVSDWSATWSFVPSSVAVVPVAPALSLPENDATSLPTEVMLKWLPSAGALGYEIHVSMTPGFESRIADLQVDGTSQDIRHLVNGYTYYWRIRATSAVGTSGWSQVRKFVCVV
jgi:hypothetical protein